MKNWKKLELTIVTAGLLCCMACWKDRGRDFSEAQRTDCGVFQN